MKNWLVIFLLCQVSCIDRSIQENFQLQKGSMQDNLVIYITKSDKYAENRS